MAEDFSISALHVPIRLEPAVRKAIFRLQTPPRSADLALRAPENMRQSRRPCEKRKTDKKLDKIQNRF